MAEEGQHAGTARDDHVPRQPTACRAVAGPGERLVHVPARLVDGVLVPGRWWRRLDPRRAVLGPRIPLWLRQRHPASPAASPPNADALPPPLSPWRRRAQRTLADWAAP